MTLKLFKTAIVKYASKCGLKSATLWQCLIFTTLRLFVVDSRQIQCLQDDIKKISFQYLSVWNRTCSSSSHHHHLIMFTFMMAPPSEIKKKLRNYVTSLASVEGPVWEFRYKVLSRLPGMEGKRMSQKLMNDEGTGLLDAKVKKFADRLWEVVDLFDKTSKNFETRNIR
jgi:hypothetical protein